MLNKTFYSCGFYHVELIYYYSNVMKVEISKIFWLLRNAFTINSADPDEMLHFVDSHCDLHCLLESHYYIGILIYACLGIK